MFDNRDVVTQQRGVNRSACTVGTLGGVDVERVDPNTRRACGNGAAAAAAERCGWFMR